MSFRWRWPSRSKWEQEMSEELRDHIERQTAANIAAGMSTQEARRQAVLQFGGVEGLERIKAESERVRVRTKDRTLCLGPQRVWHPPAPRLRRARPQMQIPEKPKSKACPPAFSAP
jgi:hypothetical protein